MTGASRGFSMRGRLVLAFMLMSGSVGCVTVESIEPQEWPSHSCRRPYATTPPEPSPRVIPYNRSASIHEYRATRRTPTSPGSWYPLGGKISPRWTTIVIHHSATEEGGAKVFDRYHKEHNGWDELGYHFVIGNGTGTPDGMIEVGPRWHKQKHGAHCKTPSNYYNEHGIGICLVGDFTKTRPTSRQLDSLRRLVRFLIDQTGISLRRVTTHRAVTGKTQCPGRYFSVAALRRSLSTQATATSLP